MAKGQSGWIRTREELRAKIIDRCVMDDETGCWMWQRCRNGGYAQMRAKRIFPDERWVHRMIYQLDVGEIAGVLHHDCGNRACCNPAHLRDVSVMEHVAIHRPETCPLAHAPNWSISKDGKRHCRDCDRIRKSRDRKNPAKADRLREQDRLRKRRIRA